MIVHVHYLYFLKTSIQGYGSDVPVQYFWISSDRTKVGLITFGDDATLQFDLDQYSTREDVLQAIDMLTFTGGRTNTQAALAMSMNQLFANDRASAPNLLVIFTDGESNVEPENTIPMAIQVSQSNPDACK